MILHPRNRFREARTFVNEVHTLAAINHLESMSLEEIKARQGRMLRNSVEYAFRHVPHYKNAFRAAGVSLKDVRTVDDLYKIPVLTKEEVLAGFPDQIMSNNFGVHRAFHSVSSGTSGMRCRYLTDWATRDANFGLLYRARSLFGYRPRHVEYRFSWGPSANLRWFQRLGFQRWVATNIRDPPEDTAKKILEVRPDSIYGRPYYLQLISSLLSMKENRKQNRKQNQKLKPVLVLSSGEMMDESMRQEISMGFNAPVVNMYGAAEHNLLAMECPEERCLHLNMLNTIIEVSVGGETASRGEAGEVLITQLTNKAMPLIRYRLGDIAIISENECNCKRRGEVLSKIQGRKDDMIKTRDGRELPPELFSSIMTKPGIKGHMIIQEKIDRIIIKIISNDLSPENRALIKQEFHRVIGDPETEVELESVDKILPDSSGKRRLIISKVKTTQHTI